MYFVEVRYGTIINHVLREEDRLLHEAFDKEDAIEYAKLKEEECLDSGYDCDILIYQPMDNGRYGNLQEHLDYHSNRNYRGWESEDFFDDIVEYE